MTLLEEAKAHREKMREHRECCGMPIFRRMVERLEEYEACYGNVPQRLDGN